MRSLFFLSSLVFGLTACGDNATNSAAGEEELPKDVVITFSANGKDYECSKTKNGRPSVFLYEDDAQRYTVSGGDGDKIYFNLLFKGPFSAGAIADPRLNDSGQIKISVDDRSYRNAADKGASFKVNITEVKTIGSIFKKANGTFEGTLYDQDKKPLTITNGKFTSF
jgi:hypothetical protein